MFARQIFETRLQKTPENIESEFYLVRFRGL